MAASGEQQYKLLFETVIFHKRILWVYFNVGIYLLAIFNTWIPNILMLSFFLFFFPQSIWTILMNKIQSTRNTEILSKIKLKTFVQF